MVSSSSQNRPELIWEFQAEPALQKNQEASAKFKGVIDATGPKNSLLACQFLAGTDEASRRRTMIATFYKMHPVPSGVTSRHFAPKGERWEPPPSQAAHSRNKASSNIFAFSIKGSASRAESFLQPAHFATTARGLFLRHEILLSPRLKEAG